MAKRATNVNVLDPLVLLCRAHALPVPQREVCFHPTRKWRADYLWPAEKVILEREGGFFKGGRGGGSQIGGHSSAGGIRRDMQKSNAAQLLGYRYFRAEPREIDNGNVIPMLKRALLGQGDPDVSE